MALTIFRKPHILILVFCALLFINPAFAKHKHSHQIDPQISPTGQKVFVFDPARLYWAVYNSDGYLLRSGHAVGGKRHCADLHRPCMTPVGTFRIYAKMGPNFKSSKYPLPHGGASMPWAMFFRGGYAIHGSNEMPNRPASHGCIRVYPSDAKWLSYYLPVGTKVIVRPYSAIVNKTRQ